MSEHLWSLGPGGSPDSAASLLRFSRAVMLPKVESECLGLARSHGEQGHIPANMQGKDSCCKGPGLISFILLLNTEHETRGCQ